MLSAARASLETLIQAQKAFAQDGLNQVVEAAELISQSLAAGRKLLVFGNGGSAADAQHLSAELVNRFQLERPPLPAIALTTDTSVLTSIANDYDYKEIFAKQIKALGAEGDVALGISTSGTSPNVLAGLASARNKGLNTIGLSGAHTISLEPLCDLVISVPSRDTPRVQEIHILVEHLICELIDLKLFGRAR